ncbi:MAG: threonine/serine exporter family protein [Candidatus Eremiobacteraeota bacterium]|nr:threonine/serine exporter family protein [Candidatus Eremiobacteraeota bacterium]
MDEAPHADSQAAAEEVLAGDVSAELVMAIGRAYHQSGVPVDQLEQTMHVAADALHVELQVTALPTSITAAIGPGYAQRVVLLRLEPGTVDLRRLSLLNLTLLRVVEGSIAPAAALTEVERIALLGNPAPPPLTVAAYCALSIGAAIILGGHEREIVAAASIGVLVGALSVAGRYFAAVDRLFEVLAGVVATLVVTAFVGVFGRLEVYIPIVAGVVQLLPGLQITEALHELAYRNVVAGTARLGSAMMTLLSLGCGFALGIALVGPGALHLDRMAYVPIPWYELGIAVLAIASAIAVLANARRADYPWVLASCAVAELAFRFFAALPGYQVATFGGALAVGVVAKLASRYARLPETVILIPGLLILVPGSLSYESILFVLQSDGTNAGSIALASIVAAVEIVSGLLLSQLFFTATRRRT